MAYDSVKQDMLMSEVIRELRNMSKKFEENTDTMERLLTKAKGDSITDIAYNILRELKQQSDKMDEMIVLLHKIYKEVD